MAQTWQEDGPREACGVFGIYAPGVDVARVTFFGLYALQHRGQESAGIATSDGHRLLVSTESGTETKPVVAQPRRYGAFLAEVLAALREGRPPPLSLDDFTRASALIDDAYRRGRAV